MMTSSILKICITSPIAVLTLVMCSTWATAQELPDDSESAQRINQANTLVRDGKFDEAIEAYRQVTPTESLRDDLNYNLAVAEYRKGDLVAAKSLFREVAGTSDEPIAASSRYNLGNCSYAHALQLAEQDKPAAIEELREAISHYRGSLRGNPDNADARANIELANELIRKLQAEEKQQQQEQEQQQDQNQGQQQNQSDQQKSDQQQDANQDQSDQQKSDQQDQSQNSDSQQSNSPQEQNSDSQKQDSQNQDPSNKAKSGDENSQQSPPEKAEAGNQNSEQNGDQQDQQPQSDKQSQNPDQSKSQKDRSPQENSTGTPQTQQSPGKQGENQQVDDSLAEVKDDATDHAVPTGDLTAADQQNQDMEPAVALTNPNAQDGLMTKEEALKMLQSVRDRDMLRRLQQQQRERARHTPVDRDW